MTNMWSRASARTLRRKAAPVDYGSDSFWNISHAMSTIPRVE
jgi:hypothetical protein